MDKGKDKGKDNLIWLGSAHYKLDLFITNIVDKDIYNQENKYLGPLKFIVTPILPLFKLDWSIVMYIMSSWTLAVKWLTLGDEHP